MPLKNWGTIFNSSGIARIKNPLMLSQTDMSYQKRARKASKNSKRNKKY